MNYFYSFISIFIFKFTYIVNIKTLKNNILYVSFFMQIPIRLFPIHSPFGMCTQNLELQGIELTPKILTGFVDPIENIGILLQTFIT